MLYGVSKIENEWFTEGELLELSGPCETYSCLSTIKRPKKLSSRATGWVIDKEEVEIVNKDENPEYFL